MSGETVPLLAQRFPEVAQGCLNASACNYDGNALIEDGLRIHVLCVHAIMMQTRRRTMKIVSTRNKASTAKCLADADADVICDEFEVPGCTNPAAVNFSENATDDDGTCAVEGCTDENALNFDAEAKRALAHFWGVWTPLL